MDITDDLSARQLAEIAFTEEVLIKLIEPQPDAECHAIITSAAMNDGPGSNNYVFGATGVNWSSGQLPLENDEEYLNLPREHFVVMGPANREPEHRQAAQTDQRSDEFKTLCKDHELGCLDPDHALLPMLAAYQELVRVGMGDFMSNEPTFRVRLDTDTKEVNGGYERTYRIMLRPVMQPIMHNEIRIITEIAAYHDLNATVASSGSGLEVRHINDL